MFLMHPSSLGSIMSNAKSKKDQDLSAGAITYCNNLAKQFVYGYKDDINSKYLDKGNICEDDSIRLYNDVFFRNYKKNTERRENEYLTGECDIYTGTGIIDIKTSWSLKTFPALKMYAHDTGYEWQLRAYMMLWGVDTAQLAYCMVNTPVEIIGWEDESMHYVDNIPPELRITTVSYARDESLESKMKVKIVSAQSHIEKSIRDITDEHL